MIDEFEIKKGVLNKYNGSDEVVVIPDGVIMVGNGAFSRCKLLKNIKFPDTLQCIGYEAFRWCYNLKTVSVPDGIIVIGDYAFSDCKSLETIILSDTLKRIADGAFSGCYNLKTVNIPEGVISVGDYAFSDCNSLGKITLPDTLKRIRSGIFNNCYNLKEVNIPDGVTVIGKKAFSGCISLEEIKLPDTLEIIENESFKNCCNLKKVIIPEEVEAIEEKAFSDCKALEEIKLPDKLKIIENGIFQYCQKLKTVKLPERVISIGENAFAYTSLETVDIPKSVKFIGKRAFYGCDSIRDFFISEKTNKLGSEIIGAYDSDKSIGPEDEKLSAICVHTPSGSAAEKYMKQYSGVRIVNDYSKSKKTKRKKLALKDIRFYMDINTLKVMDYEDEEPEEPQNQNIEINKSNIEYNYIFDIIDDPLHCEVRLEKEYVSVKLYFRYEIEAYPEDNEDVLMIIYKNGDKPTIVNNTDLNTTDLNDTEYFYAFFGPFVLWAAKLREYIRDNNLIEQFNDLDAEKEGVIVKCYGKKLLFERVSGADRPELKCFTSSGDIWSKRPYIDEIQDL